MASQNQLRNLIEQANVWASRDIPVGPIEVSFDVVKSKINKVPKCPQGFRGFTCDPEEIEKIFLAASHSEHLVVGIVPGKGGHVVLDIDTPEQYAQFLEYGFSPTFTVQTPGKNDQPGWHLYFKKPTDVPVGNTHAIAGVDVVRADDGCIVAPGESCEFGEWLTYDDFDKDVEVVPEDLWSLMHRGDTRPETRQATAADFVDVDESEDSRRARAQANEEALEILRSKYGAHSPIYAANHIMVCRPGKAHGVSGTIGATGPGQFKNFTSEWSPFEQGGRYVVKDGDFVPFNDLSWLKGAQPPEVVDDEKFIAIIDWKEVDEIQPHIVENYIYPAKWTAFSARAKEGKTTFIVNLAVNVSVGVDPFTAEPIDAVPVLYLDCEMGRMDLGERISEVGFEPADLSNFYASDIPPQLDTPEGGQKLLATVLHYKVRVVVIDGLNGALQGEENDSTTIRNFFDYTIRPLKVLGVAIITGDNTGKDRTKGPRGTSTKLDKPDAVFTLFRTDDGIKTQALVRRTSLFIAEESFKVVGLDGAQAVQYRRERQGWPDGTRKAADLFDKEGIDINWGRPKIRKYLRQRNITGVRNDVISAAQKFRKLRVTEGDVRRIVETAQRGDS